ncbi:polysaccharide pyruvyl transferase family protein [Myroides odoratimimus]|uniref:Polysaccharide pyruvyl transferase domain-containing protein n=1 Tax=Myroides odoratimimus TaxID=76832 RepID=A0AAI8G6Q3_9FLAO|nr:polysaccharide pyruvyl transferase family protein [Myroides odoratimimus]ALU28041.1 hypothetical protein AS202_18640 [Myroides odoratimimus]
MRRKVGILTLPPVSNYGGILQNFALQEVLRESNIDVITLERRYENSGLRGWLSSIKGFVYRCISRKPGYKIPKSKKAYLYSEQTRFKSNFIKSSPLLFSSEELKEFIYKEDITHVIVGSDQVWRADYTNFLTDMFFCFLHKDQKVKKLAYAASFGKDTINYNEKELEIIRLSLEEFSLISVREESGIKICSEFFKQEAFHVLDPTLLLSKKCYIDRFSLSIRENNQKKGVYTYLLDMDDNKVFFLENLKKNMSKDIYNRQPKCFEGDISSDIEDYKSPSIEDWLQGFLDADLVVTDSFHGTVFSIIFNIPFYAIVNKSKGASRFESLLKSVGLEDRLIDFDLVSVEDVDINCDIDYSYVNSRVDKLIEYSKELLFRNL